MPVPGIRTVFVMLSPLLGDIIRRLTQGRVSIDVIAVINTADSLEERLRELSPELILIGLGRGEDDAIAAAVAAALPGTRLLALSHDAKRIWLHQAGRHRHLLADPSVQELIAAIRGDLDRRVDGI